eukprot:CAMPEP_0195025060 /NCGR_PEP_ID=MMETSP0326_2-20130528/46804_1 /TAXON_ID=2866 ORGANISM="Crypthecodinium cohnii, Strain Seligo" /NCGR_SAMPLE_ID=MMETSP0326_2 /ASSEMBLY_ACC=CAM_ASM_000348 /LENGTH=131 /DNA_ID=CAMNT_0040046219 /DNA_START=381 /DNA_END=773 /DNA_ORIENTATION=-
MAASEDWGAEFVVLHLELQTVDVNRSVDHTNGSPVLNVVVPAHPKGPIILILEADSPLHFWMLRPLLRVVSPGSLPLSTAPWISDLKQSVGRAANAHDSGVDFPHLENAVSMAGMESSHATGLAGAQDTSQ